MPSLRPKNLAAHPEHSDGASGIACAQLRPRVHTAEAVLRLTRRLLQGGYGGAVKGVAAPPAHAAGDAALGHR